ncbi:MAG: V-type ATP synthase subunit F [Candidatus Nanohalobium sp.]
MKEDLKKDIAVLGCEEFTLGFELAGVSKTFNPEDFQKKIKALMSRDDLGIVIVEDKDLKKLPGRIREDVDSSVDPIVISLSHDSESERLQQKIKKAIGADITQ